METLSLEQLETIVEEVEKEKETALITDTKEETDYNFKNCMPKHVEEYLKSDIDDISDIGAIAQDLLD
jgi:hypothetical protein